MDRDDRPRSRRDRRFDLRRVDVVGIGLDVDENRFGAGSPDRAGGGEERVRRRDHLIAGADTASHQRQEQRIRSRGAADTASHAAILGQLGLERFHFRAHHEHLALEEPKDHGLDFVADRLILRLQVEGRHGDGFRRDSHRRSLL